MFPRYWQLQQLLRGNPIKQRTCYSSLLQNPWRENAHVSLRLNSPELIEKWANRSSTSALGARLPGRSAAVSLTLKPLGHLAEGREVLRASRSWFTLPFWTEVIKLSCSVQNLVRSAQFWKALTSAIPSDQKTGGMFSPSTSLSIANPQLFHQTLWWSGGFGACSPLTTLIVSRLAA